MECEISNCYRTDVEPYEIDQRLTFLCPMHRPEINDAGACGPPVCDDQPDREEEISDD